MPRCYSWPGQAMVVIGLGTCIGSLFDKANGIVDAVVLVGGILTLGHGDIVRHLKALQGDIE